MITTGFDAKVKVQQIIENQLPEYVLTETPNAVDFFKQYYISQEYQGGPIDVTDNLDQYIKLDNLSPEVIVDTATLSVGITTTATDIGTVTVSSTKGYPNQYGLFKIDDEIFTYTGITTTGFTGVIRGFSGITEYNSENNPGELTFSSSSAELHTTGAKITNLSTLFLKEFYRKIKYSLTPGLEDSPFVSDLNVGNFIKESRSFYESKGTEESFRILFEVLYGVKPSIIDLEQFLIKPSAAEFIRREIVIAEVISGDPNGLVGQTIVKSTDSATRASVSEVEPFTRSVAGVNKTFYKLSLFVGYNDRDLIEGTFTVPGRTKVIGDVSIGSSVITVDSTIGFGATGIVISNNNHIVYRDKTVNQFLDCTGIGTYISTSEDLRSDEIVYGYEDGDLTKKVEIRITGVLNKFVSVTDAKLATEGEEIYVKNIGEKILNPESDKSRKEIFTNSWIYNTSSRYQIEPTISGSTFVLHSSIDDSSLKEGDTVELLERNTQIIVKSPLKVDNITQSTRTITVSGLGGWAPPTKADGSQFEFDIRRVLNKATSWRTPIKYGENVVTSDVQNVYNDSDKDLYVASGSLPSYKLRVGTASTTTASHAGPGTLLDKVGVTDVYRTIAFNAKVPFITGDAVWYTPETQPIVGLSTGLYFVKVVEGHNNRIRLYKSRSFILPDTNIGIQTLGPGTGTHTFTLQRHYGRKIDSQKIFRKFPIEPNIKSGKAQKTMAGPVGILKNGVEVYSYKSDDIITYGPIENISVLNGGSNYDVINPPIITVTSPGAGKTTALLQPVINGSIKDVYIDTQDFDIRKVNSITITGGNGTGARLSPILARRFRDLTFDGRLASNAGGVDNINDNLSFTYNHNLLSGEPLVYDNLGNKSIGVSTNLAVNVGTGQLLQSGSRYWPKVIGPKTIELYPTESDYKAGIGTVGFTTENSSGTHKFILFGDKNTLQKVKVVESGSGFQNRKLTVNPTGINTTINTINFPNHGFNDGEIIEYSSQTTSIKGISELDQYYVSKIDDNRFRLTDTGIDEDTLATGSQLFGGISDHINVAASSDFALGTGDFTFEIWIKTAVSTVDGISERIIYMTDGPSGNNANNLNIGLGSGPKEGIVRAVCANVISLESTTLVNDNKWHHIAVSRSSGISKIFIDGILENTSTVSYNVGSTLNGGSPRPRIGSWDGTNGDWDGHMTNLRIIKGTGIYNKDFTPSRHPLKDITGTILLCLINNKQGGAEAYKVSPGPLVDVNVMGVSKATPFDVGDGTKKYHYLRKNYVEFGNSGTGYQYFKYPDISVVLDVEYTTTTEDRVGVITATPIIRGSITDVYTYENGTGYGSTILNFAKTPILTVSAGKGCQLKPIISEGRLINVEIQNRGNNYTAAPDLEVVGIGSGIGAKLRAELTNGQVSSVKILNSGVDYIDYKTSIKVTTPGSGVLLEPNIRELRLNNFERFGDELLVNKVTSLEYSLVGYAKSAQESFGDGGIEHSPIIGWAYDGNPIYGPYAYSDPKDRDSNIKLLKSGYNSLITNIADRPVGFSTDYFVEDFIFDNSGDLDKNNGRYCRTPDYPNGTYAYFAGISTDNNPNHATNGSLAPAFPYFIGDTYRSDPIEDNFSMSQSNFDFNNTSLMRNTFPYMVSERYSNNDFIIESNEAVEQISIIESVSKGSVDSLQIVSAGSGYKVGESATFDNTGTNGSGLSAHISNVEGVGITSIATTIETYLDAPLTWVNEKEITAYISESHNLDSRDIITLSGLSTDLYTANNRNFKIGITTSVSVLYKELGAHASVGIVTDIYLASIPDSISVGSSIGIGTEKLSVLNVYPEKSILRVKRNSKLGTASSISTRVEETASYLTIPAETDQFDSRVNDIVYFNPKQAVGLGSTAGISTSVNYTVGESTEVVSIQHQTLYLPNHGFKNSQKVTWTTPNGAQPLSVRDTPAGQSFNLPASGSTQDLYVINKSPNYIGLTTQIGLSTSSTGVFFVTDGFDSYEYSLTSNYVQQKGRIDKIIGKVSVGAAHSLSNRDAITLTVSPNQSVGIGTSTAIYVKYNATEDFISTDPVGFSSSQVKADQIDILEHTFKTGEKVSYDSLSGPAMLNVPDGIYYVWKINANSFSLCETYKDAIDGNHIGIGSTGGISQQISKIHPEIRRLANNNLVFDLSDSSLTGRKLKLYYDPEFKNEFVSTGSTTSFVVNTSGTPGTAGATLTLDYLDTNPNLLYYNLEKAGTLSTSHVNTFGDSSIIADISSYNGQYEVFGVGTNTFNISLYGIPERMDYTQSNTDVLKYSTNAKNARGGVASMDITFGGYGYKRLPSFTSIGSTQGYNAELLPKSKNANKIGEVRIKDPGFEYPSDKTLKPEAFISPIISVINSDEITSIEVVSGGSGYVSLPDLTVVDPETGLQSTEGILESTLSGTSISKVDVIESPKGLTPVEQKIIATNNTNGFAIRTVTGPATTGNSGLINIELVTPVLGFNTTPPPFKVGDKIFVEGIVSNSLRETELGVTGITGFNSEDYKYNLFTITAFNNLPAGATITYDVSGILTSTRPGIAVTSQNSYAFVVREDDYPTFKVTQSSGDFKIGERLLKFVQGQYILIDLYITDSKNNSIKVNGSALLKKGDVIRGITSGNTGTINSIDNNVGRFDISYSLRQDKGWTNDIGKLNQDYQKLPDNDYYQNLSYTIQSPITYENIADPVNRLLHTSGLKNFADVGIGTTVPAEAGITSHTNATTVVRDIYSKNRVDTIYDFDLTKDIDISADGLKSKFLKLKSTKLTDYIECISNRVLAIDDISSEFSNTTSALSGFTDTPIDSDSANFLIQIINPANNDVQVTELEIYQDISDIFTIEASNLYSTQNPLGEIIGTTNSVGTPILRFTPADTEDSDYDIKVIKNSFNTILPGINTASYGFVNLTGVNKNVSVGTTVSIISNSTVDIESYFVTAEVVDVSTDEKNFVELYVTHDGTNSYIAEYYAGNSNIPVISSNFIGTFTSNITSNVLSLDYENNTSNEIRVRSRVVGFGTTAAGIGTFRMKELGQTSGTERTLMMESSHGILASGSAVNLPTPATGISSSLFSTVKTLVKVSCGATIAMHQLLMTHDGTDIHYTQYPLISIGSTTGMGQFKAISVGTGNTQINYTFEADSDIGANNVDIWRWDELIYKDSDLINAAPPLDYGTARKSLTYAAYNAINGDRSNKYDFELKHDGVPIFQKTFNPSNTTQLVASTGIFTLTDHFFRGGEKLVYTPKSSYTGITAAGIQSATGLIPSEVYVIRIDKDRFRLTAGPTSTTGMTYTNLGVGNAHTLEMSKKLSKSLLSVDNVIQSPVTYTSTSTALNGNNGSITTAQKIFSVVGIASITIKDSIKIGTEYMDVVNVGVGTSAIGPITGLGTHNLLEVSRGFYGTDATTHNDAAVVRIYSGSYNLVGSKVWFSSPPKGNSTAIVDAGNLPAVRSDFNGRVYLRDSYSDNRIFDDVSESFTGIGATYRMSVESANVTGIKTGSTILLMNGMFQQPSTSNNLGNNYSFAESVGVTSVIYTGITSTDGSFVVSEADVNQNQLPRGGLIVSVGSTGGLGLAPLHGARVRPLMGANKSISSIVGIGTTGTALGITTAFYNTVTGDLDITTSTEHGFRGPNELVKLVGLAFTCSRFYDVSAATYNQVNGDLTLNIGPHLLPIGEKMYIPDNALTFTCTKAAGNHTYPRSTDPISGKGTPITAVTGSTVTLNVGAAAPSDQYPHTFVTASAQVGVGTQYVGLTTTIYPKGVTFPGVGLTAFSITGINSAFGFRCNVGLSTIKHTYVGSGTVFPYYSDLDWGQGYRNIGVTSVGIGTTAVGVQVVDEEYTHKFVSATSNAIIVKANGGPGTNTTIKPVNVSYASTSGRLQITKDNHGALVGTAHTAATGTTYDPTCGIMTVRLSLTPNFQLQTGQMVRIADSGVSFSCNFGSGGTKAYPRSSDPMSGRWVGITTTAVNEFYINVLDPSGERGSLIPSTNTDAHTWVSGVTGAISISRNKLEVSPNALTFTCSRDNHKTNHTYPRTTDPAHGNNLDIIEATDNTFVVNVGAGGGAGSGAVVTAEVVPNLHTFISRQTNCIGITTGGSGNITPDTAASRVPSYDPATGELTFHKQSGHPLVAPGLAQTATNAVYDPNIGIVTITTQTAHGYSTGDFVQIQPYSLTYSCGADNNTTNHRYPRPIAENRPEDPIYNKWIQISAASGSTFQIQCLKDTPGPSASASSNTTVHTFVAGKGGGTGIHKFVSAVANGVIDNTNATHTVTNATYNPTNGDLVLTIAGHGLTTSNTITIVSKSLSFTCDADDHCSTHAYPRASDPAFNQALVITSKTTNTLTVKVGQGSGGGIVKANSTIQIVDSSLTFSCAQDNHASEHTYPRTTDPQRARSIGIGSTGGSAFVVNVGRSPAGTGGALKFDVKTAGTGYVNPRIVVDSPTYENLDFKSVSRLGVGPTDSTGSGLLLSVDVGAATTTGIGSEMYEVSNFEIARSGYGFKIGDIIRPVGLVTSRYSVTSCPLSTFDLTITDTFTDNFSSWNFGDLDQIDSIKNIQDGKRLRYPLRYNEDLLSVERSEGSSDAQLIDLDTVLLIFINGVLQNPGEAYIFEGGSTVLFRVAPGTEDNVAMYFYKGSSGVDSKLVTNINETIKSGDDVRVLKNNGIGTTRNQNDRVISGIVTTDTVETTLYTGKGINTKDWKSLSWTKQKTDRFINGELYSKSRDSIESMIYPTSRIIKDLGANDSIIHLDNADFFKYEQNRGDNDPIDFDAIIFNSPTIVATAASFTPVVSVAGTISSLTIVNAGSGYVGATTSVFISAPITHTGIGITAGMPNVGIGTTARATATATITNGSIASVAINNGGFGYTTANLPQTLISIPTDNREEVDDIQVVQGFSGIITGISTTNGVGAGAPLGLKLELVEESGATFSHLAVGDALFVHDTKVGNGVTTIDNKDADVVGIGTTFADGIYYVKAITNRSVTVNVHSGIDTTGMGPGVGATALQGSGGVGKFSWGRVSGIGRSTPAISIGVTGWAIDYTFDENINATHDGVAGLSTFPVFQRRGYGLRTNGGLQKEIS